VTGLLPPLAEPDDGEAIRFGDTTLSYEDVRDAAVAVARSLDPGERVLVWATPSPQTCVAVVGALSAGAVAVPVNPRIGSAELEHVLTDAAPRRLLAPPRAGLPEPLRSLERLDVDLAPGQHSGPPSPAADPGGEAPAFVFYTSGTTGPPKGVVVPRRAIASNLDALAEAWELTSQDVLAHGLPLFHVHGLVLGVLGPLRVGARLHHLGRFSAGALASELAGEATTVYGVPTMHADLADAAERDPATAAAMRRARLLVSGSAALPVRDFERIARFSGQRVVERYGTTETLMICAVRAAGERRPGFVGPPVRGVDVRIVDEDGDDVERGDCDAIGEVLVRGPNLFLGYLNRPDATSAALRDGWFATGDIAGYGPDGSVRIVGRRATDLIKTGGFKVGAGEVEAALMEHPAVAEAAVTGEPDDRLGERIVAWVVPKGPVPTLGELQDLVAERLGPHKRPRELRCLERLPRNDMGKVLKNELKVLPE